MCQESINVSTKIFFKLTWSCKNSLHGCEEIPMFEMLLQEKDNSLQNKMHSCNIYWIKQESSLIPTEKTTPEFGGEG